MSALYKMCIRDSYITYTQQNAEAFFAQLEQWNDEDEYTRCIQAVSYTHLDVYKRQWSTTTTSARN